MSAEKEVVVCARNASAMSNVMWTHKTLAHNEPIRFCDPLIELIEKTAGSLGLSTKRMTSGAVHDAQNMAQIAPTAMIFVPSRDGISHSPLEFTTPEQITRGAKVLMNAAWSLV
jgi:N-carbamoyl-L-amino-acid hydrolase